MYKNDRSFREFRASQICSWTAEIAKCLLEAELCNVDFKVYENVANFDSDWENIFRRRFARRHYSSVARTPTEILERRDVLKE